MRPTYSVETIARFEDKIAKTDDCWLWTAAANNLGYGQLRVAGKALYAHRISYEIYTGEIATGLVLRHTCDNPRCVNPQHLLLGTKRQNTRDAVERERFGAQRKVGRAKITWKMVDEIKKMLAPKTMTKAQIARHFNIHAKSVYHIEVGNQWVR